MFKQAVLLGCLSIIINGEIFSQVKFYKIPSQIIFPGRILKTINNLRCTDNSFNSDSVYQKVDSFEISEQISYKELKVYLNQNQKDSSQQFYEKQLSFFYDGGSGVSQQYINSNRFDKEPIAGISYEAAVNYCSWKTIKDFYEDTTFQYVLPKVSSWLSAFHYLDSAKMDHDFNQSFSDWTTSLYYEGSYNVSSWQFDMAFEYQKNDPSRMKRKRTIGRSFLKNYATLYTSILNYEYGFNGTRDISFRIVKLKKINK